MNIINGIYEQRKIQRKVTFSYNQKNFKLMRHNEERWLGEINSQKSYQKQERQRKQTGRNITTLCKWMVEYKLFEIKNKRSNIAWNEKLLPHLEGILHIK